MHAYVYKYLLLLLLLLYKNIDKYKVSKYDQKGSWLNVVIVNDKYIWVIKVYLRM